MNENKFISAKIHQKYKRLIYYNTPIGEKLIKGKNEGNKKTINEG